MLSLKYRFARPEILFDGPGLSSQVIPTSGYYEFSCTLPLVNKR